VGEFGIGRPKESNCLAPVKLKNGMLFSWASHGSNQSPGSAQFFDGCPNLHTKKWDRMHFTACTQVLRPGTAPELGLERALPTMPPPPNTTVDTDYKGSYPGPAGEIPGIHKRTDFASRQGQMAKELKRTVRLAVEDIRDHGHSSNHPIRLAGSPNPGKGGKGGGRASTPAGGESPVKRSGTAGNRGGEITLSPNDLPGNMRRQGSKAEHEGGTPASVSGRGFNEAGGITEGAEAMPDPRGRHTGPRAATTSQARRPAPPSRNGGEQGAACRMNLES